MSQKREIINLMLFAIERKSMFLINIRIVFPNYSDVKNDNNKIILEIVVPGFYKMVFHICEPWD